MKEVILKNQVAKTTEEYEALVAKINEQGGDVIHVSEFIGGGVVVQYQVPKPASEK